MKEYGAAVVGRAGINTANAAYFQIRPTATTRSIKVLWVAITTTTAPTNAPAFYVARSTAVGTQTATMVGLAFDPSDPTSIANVDSAFSADPTFTTANKLAVSVTGATSTSDQVFDFRANPLVLAADITDGLVIANANASGATAGVFNLAIRWRE